MNLSSFIPQVRNRFIFFFMSTSNIHLAINFRLELNLFKQMLITSLKLIQPLNSMFINNIKTIISSFVFSLSVISPSVSAWNIDNNPVVLKSPHSNICHDH